MYAPISIFWLIGHKPISWYYENLKEQNYLVWTSTCIDEDTWRMVIIKACIDEVTWRMVIIKAKLMKQGNHLELLLWSQDIEETLLSSSLDLKIIIIK